MSQPCGLPDGAERHWPARGMRRRIEVVGAPLNDRQRAVLDWIAAGCPAGEEPVPTYKHSASALASRGLIDLDNRYGTPWRARLTARGRYWLEHGAYPPVGMVLEPLIEVDDTQGEEVSDAEFV